VGAKSEIGLPLFKSHSSYYHQHHSSDTCPDGVPEELWHNYGAGFRFGGVWIFVIFLIIILLLFI
jgi:hypothetical protein